MSRGLTRVKTGLTKKQIQEKILKTQETSSIGGPPKKKNLIKIKLIFVVFKRMKNINGIYFFWFK